MYEYVGDLWSVFSLEMYNDRTNFFLLGLLTWLVLLLLRYQTIISNLHFFLSVDSIRLSDILG